MNKALKKLKFRAVRGIFRVASSVAPGATGRYLGRRFVTPAQAGRTSAAEALQHVTDMRRDTITVLDNTIATYVWGDPTLTPYVMLGHGWSSYALRCAGWVPRLRAAGYAVVTFDQVAHGLSTGRSSSRFDFPIVMRHIGRRFGRPTAFIGHSLGAIAIPFAEEEAWRPSRFVLVAPMVNAAEGARRMFRNLGVSEKALQPFEDWLSQYSDGSRLDDYHASLRVPRIHRPALIIHDRLDRETPWEEGAAYARLWPQARLFTTEGLGHNRLIDHASVIDEVMNFLGPASRVEAPCH